MNKTLLIAGLSACSLVSSPSLQVSANSQITNVQEEEHEDEACTFMYVGKNVSETGRAIVARSGDSGPRTMNLNFKITKHNELANTTVTAQNGFSWQMPKTTYRYISTPRNINVHSGQHWEVSGINEKGVGVSATLSCGTNDVAQKADPFVSDGLGEDNLTQIIAAVSTTAREGIEYVAHILDVKGSCDPNAIMVIDKNETWYMEMYTGHQYLAIKMPDDKATTIGNEFLLNTLHDLHLNKDEYIASPGLFSLPEKQGFAWYVDGHQGEEEYMHLYETYGDPLVDSCHMRTWRGHNLFAKNNDPQDYLIYHTNIKYEPFFTPDRNLGVSDVTTFMRDRYESILEEPGKDPNYTYFNNLEEQHRLRYVGTNTAYQIHIIQVHPELPEEIACEEWVCLSNSNHAPFVPISNGVNTMSDYYLHESEHYAYDDQSAVNIYKRLNALADVDHKHYGVPIQTIFDKAETDMQVQYTDLLDQVKDLPTARARDILTNYTIATQEYCLATSNNMFEDLTWHIANLSPTAKDEAKYFKPLVDLEVFGKLYGWKYKRNGDVATLKQDRDTIEVNLDYLYDRPGKISMGGQTDDVKISIKNDIPYIDYEIAAKYITTNRKVATLNINDFDSKIEDNHAWVIPVAIVVPVLIAGAIIVPVTIFNFKKKTKQKKA